VEEAAKQTVTTNGHAIKSGRKDLKSRALTELAPNGNLSCLLTTADPDMATRTHFLYETGGNIGKTMCFCVVCTHVTNLMFHWYRDIRLNINNLTRLSIINKTSTTLFCNTLILPINYSKLKKNENKYSYVFTVYHA